MVGLLPVSGAISQAQVPNSAINVQHYKFALQLNDASNNIQGQAAVTVQFIKPAQSFSLNLVKRSQTGKGMLVSSVKEAGKIVKFKQDSDALTIYTPVQSGQHTYTINYNGIPADGLIISTNKYGHRTFFGDNWPNRAHNWLPCVDDPADKASVEFVVTAPAHYQVIANGLKKQEKLLPNQMKLTHWAEVADLPTKVMVIGVANFAVEQSGKPDDIPVYSYVFPENREAGFKSYKIAANILPFFIQQIGPFAYQKLANVQSKTIFGGMENAGAIFYFEESVNQKKGVEDLIAHETAHQWFGDAISEKDWHHVWLSEGFATYMTNYYLERKYGADSLQRRMAQQRSKVQAFEMENLTPVVDTTVHNNYMQLLNANSYEKGSWVLHMLRRRIGDAAFWQGIRTYYAKYKGRNANTDDFRLVMEQASHQSLQPFFQQWLLTAGMPDLAINWRYDQSKQTVALTIIQQQQHLFELPLEVKINHHVYTVNVIGKETRVQLPAGASNPLIVIDPKVTLLSKFNVVENKN
ncbi:M1 family metallopeptidase [Mucilaginibacter koreensis]